MPWGRRTKDGIVVVGDIAPAFPQVTAVARGKGPGNYLIDKIEVHFGEVVQPRGDEVTGNELDGLIVRCVDALSLTSSLFQ